MLKPIYLAPLLVLALLSTALAQESATATQTSSLTITAAATGDAVRITAPSSIVQMHVEVYAAGGERVFDQEIRGGNVFDWHLQDSQAQRLAPGAYVCVVTAKNVSGRLTQKVGTVVVAEKSASLQPAGALQLSLQQTQAIGSVEADSSWTIAGENEPQTPTVIANDGTDGQMIRGRGALTFRIGNFFSGVDQEQMRLTEAGNLGIGTSTPQSKLDVAGTIRAERFLVVRPKLASGGQTAATQATDNADSVQPLIAGTGTQNQIAKWTDNSGTLGDSGITENGGNVGIGTTSPVEKLDVNGNVKLPSGYNLTWGGSYAANIPTILGVSGGSAHIQFRPAGSTSGETMRIAANGNVGIGTTNPVEKLDVNGNVKLPSGYNLTWGGSYAANIPTIIGVSGGSAHFQFRPSGSTSGETMRIAANGNVGIGTTTPATKLDVAGDINTSTGFNIGGNRVLSAPGTNNLFAGYLSGINSTGFNSSFFGAFTGSNNTGFGNSFFGQSSGMSNTTGQNNSFFGNLAGLKNNDGTLNTFMGDGAGLNNTSGAANVFIGASAGRTNDSGQSNTTIGYRSNVGGGALVNATAIGASAQVSQSDSLVLGSINGTNFASTDTKVGIGTTAPANPLDVNGVGTQFGGVGGFGEVAARFRQRTAGTHSAVSIDALSGQDAVLYLAENGNAVWGIRNDSDQGGKFQIRLQSGGVNRPYFTLDSGGDVGIGTTTPNATLQVTSEVTEQVLSATSNLTTGTWFNLGNTGTSGNTWNLISSGTSFSQGGPGKFYIRDNNAGLVRAAIDTFGNVGIGISNPNDRLQVVGDIRVGNGTTGCVRDVSGTVLAGTCSSDIRFKRNITPFPKLLDRLVRLQPVNFYWRASEFPAKAFGSSQSFGLVAQDVEQVLPELVTEDEQGFKAVRYSKLPLLTLQGLKELKADNDSLRRENEVLKQRIDAQEVRLRKLEAKLDQ